MATPVQTRRDGGKEEKGSGHAVVIPSRVLPSRRSGGGDTETRALGAEGVVFMESVEVAVTVDDLESGRSTGAMKREKCPQHMVSVIETTNSGTWGTESFEEGDQNANGSRVCALCTVSPCYALSLRPRQSGLGGGSEGLQRKSVEHSFSERVRPRGGSVRIGEGTSEAREMSSSGAFTVASLSPAAGQSLLLLQEGHGQVPSESLEDVAGDEGGEGNGGAEEAKESVEGSGGTMLEVEGGEEEEGEIGTATEKIPEGEEVTNSLEEVEDAGGDAESEEGQGAERREVDEKSDASFRGGNKNKHIKDREPKTVQCLKGSRPHRFKQKVCVGLSIPFRIPEETSPLKGLAIPDTYSIRQALFEEDVSEVRKLCEWMNSGEVGRGTDAKLFATSYAVVEDDAPTQTEGLKYNWIERRL
uniref:Uncharacterized protein n=1 Tax=Chromera velia CCMP2878 TaxID=1169474 RepID=A0A0G4GD62_9ALVE|eukprot:Cvel_21374.t1-p1 / transcript=Cvel_21374.t1 / gene=Cvel_21374 / organism=Chromera_velia_CCMP2878 / gene_product=hypothetical protein / transcript_product=hypothetical protein / location=Cvel_scaffold1999:11656-21637(+) / protein_length=415 / sequence_SO=supercontig / SO=protein_coding / is_pseudo=false